MKQQKFTLDLDEEDDLTIGLARLAKEIPDHELFYHINTLNPFKLKRIADLTFHGTYYDYFFAQFEGFHHDTKSCIRFIANKSSGSKRTSQITELFVTETETGYLLDNYRDVDYLITTSEPFADFSVILLPENLMFQIQNFQISPEEGLYQLIQYYE